MGRRLGVWTFIALAVEVVLATTLGNAYGVERRQATTPSLAFQVADMTTCEPANIAWSYSGPPINMTLSITDIGIPQANASSLGMETLTLSTKVNPASLSYTWSSCRVPPGSYQVWGTIASQNFLQKSSAFSVLEGSDTSCLQGAPNPTGSAENPIATTFSPVSSTSIPIQTPAVVGIVVGVVAALLFTAFGLFFCRHQHRRQLLTRKQEFSRGWNGVNSTNGSVRTVVGNASDAIGGGPSEEKLGTMNRKDSLASYDSHAMTLATLPALHHQSTGNDSTFSHSSTLGAAPERHVPIVSSHPQTAAQKEASRRRKPAPVYKDSDVPPFPSSLSSQSHPSPILSHPQSATIGHYATRAASSTRLNMADGGELLHNTSFGPAAVVEGKQLHYLMPDLPAGATQL